MDVKTLSIEEVAKILGMTRGALATMRFEGRGPRFLKISARVVRYRESDVNEWLDARTFQSTAQAA